MITIVLPPFFEATTICCICGDECPIKFSVAYCCGPTHDEIGSQSSEYADTDVGGAPACKRCHDRHYGLLPVPDLSQVAFVSGCPWCHGSLAPRDQLEFRFPRNPTPNEVSEVAEPTPNEVSEVAAAQK